MKTRKAFARIIAVLLCVLSVTALLPATAFAADTPELDAFAAVANKTAAAVKSNGSIVLYVGNYYKASVPAYGYTVGGRSVSVKFQWQVKKGSGRSYVNVRGATSNTICVKVTRGKNGWKYRCKVTARYVSAKPLYYVFSTWKVKA